MLNSTQLAANPKSDDPKPDQGFEILKDAFHKWETTHQHQGGPMANEKKRTTNSRSANFPVLPWGTIAMVAAGSYLIWNNRFRIQQWLEANGVDTPWMTRSVGEAVRSGVAKAAGSAEHATKKLASSDAI